MLNLEILKIIEEFYSERQPFSLQDALQKFSGTYDPSVDLEIDYLAAKYGYKKKDIRFYNNGIRDIVPVYYWNGILSVENKKAAKDGRLRLEKEVLQDAGFSPGQPVKIVMEKNEISVCPATNSRHKVDSRFNLRVAPKALKSNNYTIISNKGKITLLPL